MVQDPYRVLGVPRGATQDEIKKAYRKKAKECHPDFHPDDPKASEKMNEVNEAYDMLMNPDKYASRQRQEQYRQQYSGQYGSQSQYGSGSSSGRYGSYNPYGNSSSQYGGSSNYGGQYGSNGGYKGAGGWYSDFGGFDFNDFFGGAYANSGSVNTNPTQQAGDTIEIRNAVSAINTGRYQEAVNILSQVRSTGRNARWYYLCGVAFFGAGNRYQAIECMLRAVQMDPNNRTYHILLNKYRQEEQTSYTRGDYTAAPGCSGSILWKFFVGFLILQLISNLFMCGVPRF